MTYNLDLELDEAGWWVVSVREVAGCRTQARSIRQALSRAREALAACIEHADEAVLEPHVHLSTEARQAVDRYRAARARLERERLAARRAGDDAVRVLVHDVGLSVRDAGELLGLSHQRVQQVAVTIHAEHRG
ncbi:MAG: type II toxin-antitoxin system HicB family antitoxin [Coriobacteriia bacterium]|nr:type II toxin-antitoxin system HicB family antitoxin [Coriobacteriia bacterium]